MNQRRIEVQASPEFVFEKLQTALPTVGRVQEVLPSTRTMRVVLRSGLGWRTVTISVLSGTDATSLLELDRAGATDPYGYQRRAFEKVIRAIDTQLAQ